MLVYFAINDIPLLDGLRSVIKGTIPTGTMKGAVKGTFPAAIAVLADKAAQQANDAGNVNQFRTVSGSGSIISDDARKYLGVPYVWGGATPAGFDCSGLVTWVLHHDLGYTLPDNTHTVTTQFLTWGGATDVARSAAQAGDLCCSATHIGIAVDNNNMINAPTFGETVKISPIQAGMAIRRVTAQSGYAQAESANTGRLG